MSAPEIARILHQRGMARMTVKTINNTAALHADLAQSRQRGYAIDDEEHAVGLRCIAAVIYNEAAEGVAAISVSGPMARVPDGRISILGAQVKRQADAITTLFGGVLPR
jgi:IclR family acetate operon transcriptional repressor